MSDHERTSTIGAEAPTEGAEVLQFPRTRERKRRRLRLWRRRRRPKRFKVRKLRVLAVLFFLGVLAIVSALFGMFMAVASDLPPLEEPAHQPSVIVDARGRPIGTLTGNERRIYLSETEIAPVMKHAIISIEDRRFYTNSGVDLRGIARAAVEDVTVRRRRPGRLDDPAAVREDLARRRERAHGLPEAARGRARLPPHAQVVQGADPPQLPELDLLRQRRLRDRVGRADLLRLQPRRLRQPEGPAAAAPRSCCRTRPRCWRRWSPRRARSTPSSIPSRPSAGATSCCCA